MIKIFGCLVDKSPPIVANDVKNVSPILYYLGFFLPIFYSWHVTYWNHNNFSTDFANARIHGSWKIGDPLNLNSFPHMDVVTFDISFQFYHKPEDVVKHHNHGPTWIHQRTWRVVPFNQACVYFVKLFCMLPHQAFLANLHRYQIY